MTPQTRQYTAARSPVRQVMRLVLRSLTALPGGATTPPAYTPSLNFSDIRNSQYAAGTMTLGVGVN